jgi:L-rhamnonate dehydratase
VKTADTIFAIPLSAWPFQDDSQAPFRFFSWLVVEIQTDEGHVGIGNVGLCPDVSKLIIDTKLKTLLINKNPLNTFFC